MVHPRDGKGVHLCLKLARTAVFELPVGGIVSSWKNTCLHKLNKLSNEFLNLESVYSYRYSKRNWWGGIGHDGLKMSIPFNFAL